MLHVAGWNLPTLLGSASIDPNPCIRLPNRDDHRGSSTVILWLCHSSHHPIDIEPREGAIDLIDRPNTTGGPDPMDHVIAHMHDVYPGHDGLIGHDKDAKIQPPGH